jgi:hypothetical protein
MKIKQMKERKEDEKVINRKRVNRGRKKESHK